MKILLPHYYFVYFAILNISYCMISLAMSVKSGLIVKRKKVEDPSELHRLSKDELISKIQQLQAHVYQLKYSIKKDTIDTDNKTDTTRKGRPYDPSKCQKRHIALKFLYLGWDYRGFAELEDTTRTIEHQLFEALKKSHLVEARENSNYNRCGRTDKNVSSFCQVISLTVRSRLQESNQDNLENELPYCRMLNALLPTDIRIIAWAPVPSDFSARFSCVARTYKYWFPRGDLNIVKMNEALQHIVGVHDFRNLCSMDVSDGVVNYVRRIDEAEITLCSHDTFFNQPEYDVYVATITGRGFLWHQIRAILGVLFLVGQNKENTDIMEKLLDIEQCPSKPIYHLADPIPLNLHYCEFENINWIIDQESLDKVHNSLETNWAVHSVKTTMLAEMLKETEKLSTNETVKRPYSAFFTDQRTKVYQPLLTRKTAKSLKDRIAHYVGKGRLQYRNDSDVS